MSLVEGLVAQTDVSWEAINSQMMNKYKESPTMLALQRQREAEEAIASSPVPLVKAFRKYQSPYQEQREAEKAEATASSPVPLVKAVRKHQSPFRHQTPAVLPVSGPKGSPPVAFAGVEGNLYVDSRPVDDQTLSKLASSHESSYKPLAKNPRDSAGFVSRLFFL